jgi:hypothetical protein
MKRVNQLFVNVLIVFMLFPSFLYGDTWTATRRLTNASNPSQEPAIAVAGPNIYVVWYDYWEDAGIYFKRSVDGGARWKVNKKLSGTPNHSVAPAIAIAGSNIYVIWEDDLPGQAEIYLRRSTDGGVTWASKKRLTNNDYGSTNLAIAARGSYVYVVWERHVPHGGRYDPEIFFKRSIDGGVTWTSDMRLTKTGGSAFYPTLAVSGSSIYVVWHGYATGTGQIYFTRSTDRGISWTSSKRLTDTLYDSLQPAIGVSGSNIYVVWDYKLPNVMNAEVYFKRSVDGGITWTANKRLTVNDGYSGPPSIAVSDLNIQVAWHDYTPGNAEIYFRRSVDGGVAWQTTKRLSKTAGNSWDPTIGVAGSNIYVVWEEETLGSSEIFFKKGVMD